MTVRYTWTDDNELVIDYRGTTNKKTVVNMTSHGFFSLQGIGNPTPTAMDTICEINADFYVPIDETSVPTGEIRKVEGTPFDFRTPHVVGERIDDPNDEQIKNGAGYDHCFVLNKKEEGELSFAARITEPVSGRTMEVYTTEPGVQFYSDNWADGYRGQHGATFGRRSALCLRHSTSPTARTNPIFPAWCFVPARSTPSARSISSEPTSKFVQQPINLKTSHPNGSKVETMGRDYRDDCSLCHDCLRHKLVHAHGDHYQESTRRCAECARTNR